MNELRDVKPEFVPLAALKAYDGNAKKHDRANVDAIANSIAEFGFRQPILAWHNEDGEPEIVAGHGRAAAAKKLGMEDVPVIFVDDLDDAQRRMLTHADNQTTLMTGWDYGTLETELDSLADMFDITSFGFPDPEIEDNELLAGVEDVDTPADGDAEGSSWRLGEHVLICGDSTDTETIDRLRELMGGDGFDMCVTDPPYNVSYGQHMRPSEVKAMNRRTDGLVIANDEFADEQAFTGFLTDAFRNVSGSLKPGAAMYAWLATTHLPACDAAYRAAGIEPRQVLIWVKNTIVMGRQDYQWQHEGCMYGWKEGTHYFTASRKESTVFEDAKPVSKMTKQELMDEVKRLRDGEIETDVVHCDKPGKSEEHPTMKPVKLIARQIRNSSRKGDLVIDPFGGSGTTLIACEQMGRRCGTVELDPHYAQVIVKRWEELTGGKAEKIA